MKRYPFNAEKHAHDIELAVNRTYNLLHDAQMNGNGEEAERLEAKYDTLYDLMNSVTNTTDNRQIAWLTGPEIALAKETVIWAGYDREGHKDEQVR